jgi:hypothetical protein
VLYSCLSVVWDINDFEGNVRSCASGVSGINNASDTSDFESGVSETLLVFKDMLEAESMVDTAEAIYSNSVSHSRRY